MGSIVASYENKSFLQSTNFDHTGFFIASGDEIELYGNVWKVFRLEDAITISDDTELKFQMDLREITEGHLMCFAEEINNETATIDDLPCISLVDTNMEKWDQVKRAYNLALRKPTSASAIPFSWLGSRNAVDGLDTTYTLVDRADDDVPAFLSVDLENSFSITQIVISSIFGLPSTLKVQIDDNLEKMEISTDGNTTVSLNLESTNGQTIRIEGEKDNHFLISNVEIFGGPLSEISFPIKTLFEGQKDPALKYIVFVQDSSSNPFKGRSSFSDIELKQNQNGNTTEENTSLQNLIEGKYFRLRHANNPKVLAIGELERNKKSRAAVLSNIADINMSQLFLLEQAGKIRSLQYPDYYLHLKCSGQAHSIGECRSQHVNFARYEHKEERSPWLLDPLGQNNIFVVSSSKGDSTALIVRDDNVNLGIANGMLQKSIELNL